MKSQKTLPKWPTQEFGTALFCFFRLEALEIYWGRGGVLGFPMLKYEDKLVYLPPFPPVHNPKEEEKSEQNTV